MKKVSSFDCIFAYSPSWQKEPIKFSSGKHMGRILKHEWRVLDGCELNRCNFNDAPGLFYTQRHESMYNTIQDAPKDTNPDFSLCKSLS